MKNLLTGSVPALGLIAGVLVAECAQAARFVVLNRNSSSLTEVSNVVMEGGMTRTGDVAAVKVRANIDRRHLGEEVEPMYGIFDTEAGRLIFADRKNNELKAATLKPANNSPVIQDRYRIGRGAFHLSGLQFTGLRDKGVEVLNRAYAVATDLDKGFNLIEFVSSTPSGQAIAEKRFDLPSAYASGKPHDILLSERHVFLTVMGVDDTGGGKSDILLKVDRETLRIVGERRFSFDTHLLQLPQASSGKSAPPPAFVLVEQATGVIHFVDIATLADINSIQGPVGVHGVAATQDLLFVTDIDAPAGEKAVFAYSYGKRENGHPIQALDSIALANATAHNLAIGSATDGLALIVTHSGPQSSAVSILKFDETKRVFAHETTLHTGLNPFGVLTVPDALASDQF